MTIIRTHGLHTLQREVQKGAYELPRMVASMTAAMAYVLNTVEELGNLIFSVVDDDLVDALVDETQK